MTRKISSLVTDWLITLIFDIKRSRWCRIGWCLSDKSRRKWYVTTGVGNACVQRRDFMMASSAESSWSVMAHGDAREEKWRGNWRKEWVASTLHATSEHGVSSITTADAHTSAASSRMNWRPRLFKWTRPFRRKTKFGFCACATTFQTQSTACAGKPSLITSLQVL